jgi:tol-pal system protein YbgF
MRRVALLGAALVALALPIEPSLGQTPEPKPVGDTTARIENVEQQLRDLKVTVGTLESLLRSKPGVTLPQEEVQAPRAISSAESGGGIDQRIDALETQVAALTSQIEQMTKQLATFQAKPQMAAPEQLPPSEALRPLREGDASPPPPAPTPAAPGAEPDEAKSILPEKSEDADEQAEPPPSDQAPEPPMQSADAQGASPSSFPPADAATLYNQGYGDLLRRDYASAETSFRRLIETHPNDKLAGDAQYWLGESYYVRGQYKNAADAFLKGYKSYGASPKAPDSLLRLGMSLAALGQKEAACSSFAELGTKFPSAPSHVREEAESERRKAGC